jgi:amino acid adenylation domain-containing protein
VKALQGFPKTQMDTNNLNDTPSGVATVTELINRVIASAPDRLAVDAADGPVTYRELSERADLVAQRLCRAGVTAGDLVGLCVGRSTSLVVAALGIFRAGGAYVAIDPDYPAERLDWMLSDSDPVAVLTDRRTAPRLHGPEEVIVLADGGRLTDDIQGGERTPGPAPTRLRPEDLAYVVYTSGSTGRPKGAMADHAGLLNLIDWYRLTFDLDAEDRLTQVASPGFDAAVWEIWPALASGACLHVVPEALRRDPINLRDWLIAEEITVSFLPTAVVEGVIGLPWPKVVPLRYLLTGGDALTRKPSPDLPFTLVNNYGVSEATVVSTSGEVSATDVTAPSIGRPISGVVVEIVDENLDPVEPGEVGELLIAGISVGPGYLNSPEQTAERFLDDVRGRRIYRTGDNARARDDGEIEFLGRLDDQLSIRGFRVEAGEVASALNSHPGVEASVAVAAGDSSAQRQLIAYVVAARDERPTDVDLSSHLHGFLPDYMVPSSFIWLDRLPITAHGKVDRKALPSPARTEPPAVSYPVEQPPAGNVPGVIASIVAELLEKPEVGAEQNFFDLGGNSMFAAQLILRLEDLYGVEIGLRYLFDHPTPAALAVEVEIQVEVMGSAQSAVAAPATRDGGG